MFCRSFISQQLPLLHSVTAYSAIKSALFSFSYKEAVHLQIASMKHTKYLALITLHSASEQSNSSTSNIKKLKDLSNVNKAIFQIDNFFWTRSLHESGIRRTFQSLIELSEWEMQLRCIHTISIWIERVGKIVTPLVRPIYCVWPIWKDSIE